MPKKASIVDSDFFFVDFLSELLAKQGYQVTKAYDGKEGIGKREDFSVDILISPIRLADSIVGWVIGIEPVSQDNPGLLIH
jgi:DNA-binding response OmpR family regulator